MSSLGAMPVGTQKGKMQNKRGTVGVANGAEFDGPLSKNSIENQSLQMQIQVADSALNEMRYQLNLQKNVIPISKKGQQAAMNHTENITGASDEEFQQADELRYSTGFKANNQQHDIEIDKEQFLSIISRAFEKIITSMHPKIGMSLNQIRLMYEHYISQVECMHLQETHQSQIELDHFQQVASQLQEINGELQLSKMHESASEVNDGPSGKNPELLQELNNQQQENMKLAAQVKQLQDKVKKYEGQVSYFKKQMSEKRNAQNINVQENPPQKTGQQIADEIDMMEKLRRAERNDRTREMDANEFLDFDINELEMNNNRVAKQKNFHANHVLINQGEMKPQQSRKRLDDKSEDLSSIPSYDHMNRIDEKERIIFGDRKDSHIQIQNYGNEEEKDECVLEQQSYFSSKINESSATIDSDMIVAMQHAMQKNGKMEVNVPRQISAGRSNQQAFEQAL